MKNISGEIKQYKFPIFVTLAMVYIQGILMFVSNKVLGQGGLYMIAVSKTTNDLSFSPYYLTDISVNTFIFPFPPGAFYLIATIHWLTGIPNLLIARFLPPILFIMSILLFYRFLNKTHSPYAATIGSILLFTLPAVFMRQVVVDGMTTTLSFAGIMGGLNLIEDSFVKTKTAVLAGFCFGVSLIAHPAGGLFFALTYFSFWLGNDQSASGFFRGGIVAIVGFVLSSVWWLPVTLQAGPMFLIRPLITSNSSIFPTFILGDMISFPTVSLTIWSLPTIAGIYMVLKRRWWVVLWGITSLLFSSILFFSITITYISVIALFEWLIPSLLRATGRESMLPPRTVLLLAVGLVIVSGVGVGISADSAGLSNNTMNSSEWVKSNTQESAVIAVQPHQTAEWFPYLTNRTAWAYVQGLEWSDKDLRQKVRSRRQRLENCSGSKCFRKLVKNASKSPDYLLLDRKSIERQELNESPTFIHSYNNKEYVIYSVSLNSSSPSQH